MIVDIVVSGPAPAAMATSVAPVRLPALETMIARGDAQQTAMPDFDHWLFAAFGLRQDTGLPIAPYTLLADGQPPGDRYWMRADPVHLVVDQARMRLSTLAPGALDLKEADTLRATLAGHFTQIGLELIAPHPLRWYLGSDTTVRIEAPAPRTLIAALEECHLPSGPDGSVWRRLLTEAQMLLHEHPVNAAREAAGKLAINAIWPWGGGRMTGTALTARYDRVWSRAALAIGLGRASGAEIHDRFEGARDVLDAARSSRRMLVALEYDDPVETGSDFEHCGSMRALESEWCAPLGAALASANLHEVNLTLFAPRFALTRRITRACLRRWWRRARPLVPHA